MLPSLDKSLLPVPSLCLARVDKNFAGLDPSDDRTRDAVFRIFRSVIVIA